MSDEWRDASSELTDIERKAALESVLECANDPEAGIIRQLLGKEGKPLSEKQDAVFVRYIERALVERCGVRGCSELVPAGFSYCSGHAIKYGEE